MGMQNFAEGVQFSQGYKLLTGCAPPLLPAGSGYGFESTVWFIVFKMKSYNSTVPCMDLHAISTLADIYV